MCSLSSEKRMGQVSAGVAAVVFRFWKVAKNLTSWNPQRSLPEACLGHKWIISRFQWWLCWLTCGLVYWCIHYTQHLTRSKCNRPFLVIAKMALEADCAWAAKGDKGVIYGKPGFLYMFFIQIDFLGCGAQNQSIAKKPWIPAVKPLDGTFMIFIVMFNSTCC